MEFTPVGYIGIHDALLEIREALYPGECSEMVLPLDTEEGREQRRRLHDHDATIRKLFLGALSTGFLVAVVKDPEGKVDDYQAPKRYWEMRQGRTITIHTGRMATKHMDDKFWKQFDLKPCFIERAAFDAWMAESGLPNKSGTKGPKPKDQSIKTFATNLYKEFSDKGQIHFGRGGLADAVDLIHKQDPDLKKDTIRSFIQKKHNELRDKNNKNTDPESKSEK